MSFGNENDLLDRYYFAKEDTEAKEASLFATVASKRVSRAMGAELEVHREEFLRSLSICHSAMQNLHAKSFAKPSVYWTPELIRKDLQLFCNESRMFTGENSEVASTPKHTDLVVAVSAAIEKLKARNEFSEDKRKVLGRIQQEFETKRFDPKDLRRISSALQLKLTEEIDENTVLVDLTRTTFVLDNLHPEVFNNEKVMQLAIDDGNMALAQEINETQVSLLEQMLRTTEEQYVFLGERSKRIEKFLRERRWSVFRMANNDINGVIEAKATMMDICDDDLKKLAASRAAKEKADRDARDKFHHLMTDSDNFLRTTTDQQDIAFQKLRQLQEEIRATEDRLLALGRTREAEIRNRITLMEEEAARVAEHSHFISAANIHQGMLAKAREYARHCKEVCENLNAFLLYGCEMITQQLKQSEDNIAAVTEKVNRQHLQLFSEFAISAGRLLHRKEEAKKQQAETQLASEMKLAYASDVLDPLGKRQAEHRDAAAESVAQLTDYCAKLRARIDKAAAGFECCAENLERRGIPFLHPLDLMKRANRDRRWTLLDFRESLDITEDKLSKQIDSDYKQVQAEMKEHKQMLIKKQEESHRRAVDKRAATKNPCPPRSTLERVHSAAFNRYLQTMQRVQEGRLVSALFPEEEEAARLAEEEKKRKVEAEKRAQQEKRAMAESEDEGKKSTTKSTLTLEGCTAVAVFDFKAREVDELDFSKGDRIIIIGKAPEPGWCHGVANQKTGMFPLNYVRLLPTEEREVDLQRSQSSAPSSHHAVSLD